MARTGAHQDLKTYCRALEQSGLQTLEVTDGWPEDVLSYFWPKVTYKGADVINLIFALDEIRDPRQHAGYEDTQECYLGYIPSKDLVVIGWDCWGGEDNQYDYDADDDDDYGYDPEPTFFGYAEALELDLINIRPEVNLRAIVRDSFETIGGFYTRHPKMLHLQIRDKYPDLVGLRYD